MDGYMMPILQFMDNLVFHGFQLGLDADGRLRVTPPAGHTPSPVYLEEIRKRAKLIVDILKEEVAE